MALPPVRLRRRLTAGLAVLLLLQPLAQPLLAQGPGPRPPVTLSPLLEPGSRPPGATARAASPHLAARASPTALELGRRVRYSGTGWGLWTPMLFGATRGLEALTMDGASRDARLDHATRWAAEPRFWGAVGADLLATKVAGSLLSAMGVGGFAANLALCFTGFATFEGVYQGFDSIDWGTMAFQSLALTMVEVAVSSLGLPGGPLIPFMAALAVCMMLDAFDGYQAVAEDDPLYAGTGPAAAAVAPAPPGPAGTDSRDAYRRVLGAAAGPDRAALATAYQAYRAAAPAP